MPKVKWGSDIDAEAIDSSERRDGDYAGDVPPRGIYRFKLRFSRRGKSNEGNPKLTSLLVLDGSWKKDHKKYDGCPLWDHMPVTKKTAFRVRSYCDALNITSKDFLEKMIVDEEGNVQKIGKLTIADEDRLVYCKVVKEDDPEYGERLIFGKNGGYLPFNDDDADSDADDDGDNDTDDGDDDTDGDPF